MAARSVIGKLPSTINLIMFYRFVALSSWKIALDSTGCEIMMKIQEEPGAYTAIVII